MSWSPVKQTSQGSRESDHLAWIFEILRLVFFAKNRLHVCARQAIVAFLKNAGWSSLVARQAHNLKVAGSNPAPATM
jgi:hypothetical protein